MYFLETSAKEADNVERLFLEIAAELMEVPIQIIIIILLLNYAYIFIYLQQARSKELPRYDSGDASINGQTTTIGQSNCCSRMT